MTDETIVFSKKVEYFYCLKYSTFAEKMREEIADITDDEVKQYWNKLLHNDEFIHDNIGNIDNTSVRKRDGEGGFVERTIAFYDGDEDLDDYDDELGDDVDEVIADLRTYHEEERWSSIYYQGEFAGFCGEHPHLQDFKTAIYYQTYGGGPEGGYLVMPDKSVYHTDRNWGTPFSHPEKRNGCLIVKKIDGEWKCRLDED